MEVLLYKKKDIIAIQKKLGISGNANQMTNIEARRRKTLADSYELLLNLVEDIIPIRDDLSIDDELGIIGYSNQERAEEVDEKARAYLQKFEEFHGPLEDVPIVILQKYGEMGVNKIQFSREGLPLFPNLSPQQLHEIFVKNPSSTGQCPCLEQVS
ncbi:unnamed protein product [Rhizophagus irregularis]|nr:unnamed protein product [Rhizophagus irregularis]